MSRVLASRVQAMDAQRQQDEEIQRRMTFKQPSSKKDRPVAERVFAGTVTGVAIIEHTDDVDEDLRPCFDLAALDACLIPVEPVDAADVLQSPTQINGQQPLFESHAEQSVPLDATEKKKKALSAKQKEKQQSQRLQEMREDGYIVFDDAFLRSYPHLRVARLSQQYADAFPLNAAPARVSNTGKSKRSKRASYFLSAAEKEYRPCFRRCPSELFYGRAQYTDVLEQGIPLSSSLELAEQDSGKTKFKPGVLKRIFKSFSSGSMEREDSISSPGRSGSSDDEDSHAQYEVNVPPRVPSVSIRA